jgi:hypothetical protein
VLLAAEALLPPEKTPMVYHTQNPMVNQAFFLWECTFDGFACKIVKVCRKSTKNMTQILLFMIFS